MLKKIAMRARGIVCGAFACASAFSAGLPEQAYAGVPSESASHMSVDECADMFPLELQGLAKGHMATQQGRADMEALKNAGCSVEILDSEGFLQMAFIMTDNRVGEVIPMLVIDEKTMKYILESSDPQAMFSLMFANEAAHARQHNAEFVRNMKNTFGDKKQYISINILAEMASDAATLIMALELKKHGHKFEGIDKALQALVLAENDAPSLLGMMNQKIENGATDREAVLEALKVLWDPSGPFSKRAKDYHAISEHSVASFQDNLPKLGIELLEEIAGKDIAERILHPREENAESALDALRVSSPRGLIDKLQAIQAGYENLTLASPAPRSLAR